MIYVISLSNNFNIIDDINTIHMTHEPLHAKYDTIQIDKNRHFIRNAMKI